MPTQFKWGTPLNDLIEGSNERDSNIVNGQDEVIFGLGGADTISGRGGRDWIWASSSDPAGVAFFGGADDDVLVSFGGDDWLQGDEGNDVLIAGAGRDTLLGGLGDDQLWAGAGDDNLQGGTGDDLLVGDLDGEAGNDILFGGDGVDTLIGGAGNDALNGDAGNDKIYGGAGSDQINGGLGADWLFGGEGVDYLVAGRDNDQDVMVGGEGADEYIVARGGEASGYTLLGPTPNPTSLGANIVWGFELGSDVLKLPTADQVGLGPIGTAANEFISISGYDAELGLSGTMIQLSAKRGMGAFGLISDWVFLAGVDTTVAELQARGSLVYDDGVLLL